jgi:NTP pyrophosphatase (non-canonical NTP hydrolase)
MTRSDSYDAMLAAVQAFHHKHRFAETGGEELIYRVALMAEELGEISECVTKGKSREELAEEVADLMILLIGTGIAGGFDLKSAFWTKMERLANREARMIDGRIRVSDFGE